MLFSHLGQAAAYLADLVRLAQARDKTVKPRDQFTVRWPVTCVADYSQAVDNRASFSTLPLPLVHLSQQVEESLLRVRNISCSCVCQLSAVFEFSPGCVLARSAVLTQQTDFEIYWCAGRVGLVELVEHDHGCAAVVEDKPPEVSRGARQRVRADDKCRLPVEAVGESSVDVVVALPFRGNQEGQCAVGRQDIHAAVLLSVSGQQSDAALLHVQVGSHGVERLQMGTLER
ncbi:hypothetical protein EYF80_013534 [Liparis tanakae]|uniref:Uncharacterized protein n=1 Tax=Liparis tanakae TaxID=230148 RepID=A0A4Z2IE96_9TELE|nr:hypothetical protein EYF80_013534 [Liparis tanakae]